MTTNTYFSHGTRSEQLLYEDLIIESIKMYGVDVWYLPRRISDEAVDQILHEAVSSVFDTAYRIEVYLQDTTGWGGEGDLFSKFGLEIRDQAKFSIAVRRWKQIVSQYEVDTHFVPREGDLIFFPTSHSLFIVKFVDDEEPTFFQLKNVTTFTLNCELAEITPDMNVKTGIAEVDDMFNKYGAFITRLEVVLTNDVKTFYTGDTFSQTIGTSPTDYTVSGTIINVSYIPDTVASYYVYLKNVVTDNQLLGRGFVLDEPAISGSSEFTITEIVDDTQTSGTNEAFIPEETATNQQFEDEADALIDFSEDNPFGEP